MKQILPAVLIAFLWVSFVPVGVPASVHGDAVVATSIDRYIRTELYFGLSKSDGSAISESDWLRFVDEFVTPRFPQGLTVVEANGQWRGNDGRVVREKSKVLILLYTRRDRKAADIKIEEIRAEYKKRFSQESVLRLDISKSINVSF